MFPASSVKESGDGAVPASARSTSAAIVVVDGGRGRREGLRDRSARPAAVYARLHVALRQVKREGRAGAGGARELDLATQHLGDFAADVQAQAGAAVLAAGRAVRLLECLKDDLLLFGRD